MFSLWMVYPGYLEKNSHQINATPTYMENLRISRLDSRLDSRLGFKEANYVKGITYFGQIFVWLNPLFCLK